jgi:hypothetical protein
MGGVEVDGGVAVFDVVPADDVEVVRFVVLGVELDGLLLLFDELLV